MTPIELSNFRINVLGLSQYQFGYVFGHAVITISRWERGENSIPEFWSQLFESIIISGRHMHAERVLMTHGRVGAFRYLIGAPYKSIPWLSP